jgi:hypothetical protein
MASNPYKKVGSVAKKSAKAAARAAKKPFAPQEYTETWWKNYTEEQRIKDAAKQNKKKSKSGASRKVNAADVSMNNSNYN